MVFHVQQIQHNIPLGDGQFCIRYACARGCSFLPKICKQVVNTKLVQMTDRIQTIPSKKKYSAAKTTTIKINLQKVCARETFVKIW